MHEEYIEKILSTGTNQDMYKLRDVLLTSIDRLNDEDYNIICNMLYEIAEGKVLTEKRAEKIIQNMKPYGMHWTIQQTEDLRQSNDIDARPVDFWVVMNSAYNDYSKLYKDNMNLYIGYSDLFINDEDGKPEKVYLYFTTIPKNK